ncbi:MAG: hypothetical protein ACUVTM_06435 [Candidatus Bathyarchaeia archaeon]
MKQRRHMWSEAYRDRLLREVISIKNYEVHPTIPVEAGDVLISGKYIHPAVATPILAETVNIKKKRYWADIIARLPKTRVE